MNPGTAAQRELMRGDIITKIDDYDARDLRHEDAQNLFRNAGNNIRLAIQRYLFYIFFKYIHKVLKDAYKFS